MEELSGADADVSGVTAWFGGEPASETLYPYICDDGSGNKKFSRT